MPSCLPPYAAEARASAPDRRRRSRIGLWCALAAVLVLAPSLHAENATTTYEVTYDVELRPTTRDAVVTIELGPHDGLVRWLRFRNDPTRYRDWKGKGELIVSDDRVKWTPPARGGTVRYTVALDHRRRGDAYDAHCTDDWALLRGHDLVPAMRVRYDNVTRSRSTLRISAPHGWKIVTGHARVRPGTFDLADPTTNFDRPTSWILAGRLGVLRETIAGMRVTVAAPIGERARRQDMLALLRLALPKLRTILTELPPRLTVVAAGDPMWRGGLSAPGSLYVHADRPLITGDLTSPLLHEVMHAVVGTASDATSDWIVEGLAEYYSLELLVRAKAVSRRRHRRALEKIAARGRTVRQLTTPDARGAVTARAITVLDALNTEIRAATKKERSLDSVLVQLAREPAPITNARFRALAEEVAGRDLARFFATHVGNGA